MTTSWGRLAAALFTALLAACNGSGPQRPASWSAPQALVAPSQFAGVHGLAIDARGRLLAGSVVGWNITEVDRLTGATREFIGAPLGQADDIAVGPAGELAWTSLMAGAIRLRASDTAPIVTIASDLPGINSVAFDPRSGRLYASQTYSTDTLWEIDPAGLRPPRQIAQGLGGLNGFDVGPDGQIYGPLVHKGQVVRIDPASGAVTVISSAFRSPTGAHLDGRGSLWVVDIHTGELARVALDTGAKAVVARLRPGIDNLVIAAEGTAYVSNLADNTIHAVDPATGAATPLVRGTLAVPGALKIDGDALYVADLFALRRIDVRSGAVTDLFIQDASELRFPFALALDRGRIALASWFSGGVQLVDRATTSITATLPGLGAPMDVALLPDGRLVVADIAAGTLSVLSGASLQERRVLASGLLGPTQMALGADGQIYVTEAGGRLSRVSPADGAVVVVADGLAQPEGIAPTPWGSFIVAEVGTRRLLEIVPGGERRVVAGDLPLGLQAGVQGLPPPYVVSGVAVGADGAVYFSADRGGKGAVYRLAPRP